MARSSWLFLIIYLTVGTLAAQDRYMVFFKDKADSPYSVGSPEAFLSQRSIDRRAKNSVTMTEQDLPVNPAYIQALLEVEGIEVYFRTKWMNGVMVEMLPTLENTVLNLEFVKDILFVAPGNRLSNVKEEIVIPETFTFPSASTFTTDVQRQMLGVDALDANGYTGEGVLMAVFDGGFQGVNTSAAFEHLHTNQKIVATYDYVENTDNPYQYFKHGTEVLSCIVAKYESSIKGTSPDVSLILAVTEEVFEVDGSTDSEYWIEEYNWLFAAEMADSAGVDIISASVGYSTFGPLIGENPYAYMSYSYSDMDGQTAVVTKAAAWASERGILVVTSAGNEGDGSWNYITAPADAQHALSVGSVTAGKVKSGFSSFGPTYDQRTKPDVAAMGSSTVVVTNTGNIKTNNGTSFAAPLIAGFAASLWQAYPGLTRAELFDLIRNSGSQANSPDNSLGYGIPNYLVILGEPLKANENPKFEFYPNPFSYDLTIKSLGNQQTKYLIMDLQGKVHMSGEFQGTNHSILMTNLPDGIYFLQLNSGNFSETIKLLKN